MNAPRPARPHLVQPPALHLRAMDNLRFIRETMEGAARFTAVSGMGEVAVGLTALGAAFLASRQTDPAAWIGVWLWEALLGVLITVGALAWKARRVEISLFSQPGRRFALGLFPPFLAGALLTLILYQAGALSVLPGMWLLLYGTGVVTGGAFSVRIVPVMGLAFMALGGLALLSPLVMHTAWRDGFLAAGFGGLHIFFGLVIARKHGG